MVKNHYLLNLNFERHIKCNKGILFLGIYPNESVSHTCKILNTIYNGLTKVHSNIVKLEDTCVVVTDSQKIKTIHFFVLFCFLYDNHIIKRRV